MRSCKKYRLYFLDALYGDLDKDTEKWFNAHLNTCRVCATRLEKMKNTLDQIKIYQRPDPGDAYWQGYWENLSSRLESEKQLHLPIYIWIQKLFSVWSFRPVPTFGWAVISLVFLFTGFFIGKMIFQKETTSTPNFAQIQAIALENRTAHYIERSKLILLGIANYDIKQENHTGLNLNKSKSISNELIQEAVLLKKELYSSEQLRLRALVSELQLILMQIANLEQTYDLDAIELIQNSIEHKGLLFKINLEELQPERKAYPFSVPSSVDKSQTNI